ncbi:2,3-bisphosphoglycerate-independent phosphoglycerate mutase [Candidatus Bipolaricaulota bacterium]|nr:2,3-bisphosphoglycerate-independent phosphoglycerate mutase [Candidatus Bipolaricaulota bacterium]
MKGIFVIADGLGGRPTDLNGNTCLEAAETPYLDALATRGALGLVDPIGPGIRPGSDTAHLSLLGYDPFKVYTGRGVFECLGMGMDVQAGDICFRANFASVESSAEGLRLLDRRAGRISEGQNELEDALRALSVPGAEIEFLASTQHRGALRIRGEGLSRFIGETDPHEVGTVLLASRPTQDVPGADKTADIVNQMTQQSFEILRDLPLNKKRVAAGQLPANVLLVRGAANCPVLPSIESVIGARGAVIAGGALYRGVAEACGMDYIPVQGATGGLDTNIKAKAAAILRTLEDYDYVFCHLKGTDNAGHDKNAADKKAFIERMDSELFKVLIERVDWGRTHLAFTGDHCTPIDYGDHTVDPVPVLFVGPNIPRDPGTTFGERVAGQGGLGRFSGRVLPMLLGYCNWAPKFGS